MTNATTRKARTLRAAAFLALAAALLFSGCSFSGPGSAVQPAGAKGSLSLSVPCVSPALNFGRPASAGSRGYMYLSALQMTIRDQGGQTVYNQQIGTGVTDQKITATVTLAVGDNYSLDLVGTNGVESTDAVVHSLGNIFSIAAGQETRLEIGLTPVSTTTLTQGGAPVMGTNKTGVYFSDTVTPKNSHWTRNGGEKWFTIVPETNTLTITATPTGSHIYMGIYNDKGDNRGGALSSGFTTRVYGMVTTLFTGVTPGATYYIGLISPLEDPDTNPATAAFAISCSGGADDDAYEAIGGIENDDSLHPAALPDLDSFTLSGLLSFDEDWYSYSLDAGDNFSLTTDFVIPVRGEIVLMDPSGGEIARAYTNQDQTVTSLSIPSTTVETAGPYTIGLRVCGESPNKFAIVAGSYSLTYARQGDGPFADAATKIPDQYLRAAIEQAVRDGIGPADKAFGGATPILVSDMNALEGVFYAGTTGAMISNLSGIEYCPNLTWVDFSGNNISDISPIVALPNIQDIKFADNPITSLSAIEGKSSLVNLRFPRCDITSLSPIMGMTGLKGVALHGNPLDWDELAKLDGENFPELNFISIDGWDETGEGSSLGVAIGDLIDMLQGHKDKLLRLRLMNFNFGPMGGEAFTDLYDQVIAPRAALYGILALPGWGTGMSTDLLANFTGLYELDLSGNIMMSSDFMNGMTGLRYLVWSKGAPADIVGTINSLHVNGAFASNDAYFDISNSGLDLRTGTGPRNQVDYLVTPAPLGGNVEGYYIEGNIVHEIQLDQPSNGSVIAKGEPLDVSGTVSEWSDRGSAMIMVFVDGVEWNGVETGASGTLVPWAAQVDTASLTAGTHDIGVQAIDDWGGISATVTISVEVGYSVDIGIR